MSLVVLLVLAVVWAVFLIPQLLRVRAERGPADSIGAFRSQLSVLERTAPGITSPAYRRQVPVGVITRSQAQKRRRDTLVFLLGGIMVTFVLGLIPALRVLWVMNAVLDVLFVTYLVALARARALATEREMKVRYLPGPSLQPEPALIRRYGS